MLLWQGSIVEIDYGFFKVFGPYFIGKSLGTLKILIFGFSAWQEARHVGMAAADSAVVLFQVDV